MHNNNNNNNDKIFCANHGIIEFPTLISKFLICIIFVTYLFFLHKLFNKIICGFTVYMYVYRSDQIRSGQVRSDFRLKLVLATVFRFSAITNLKPELQPFSATAAITAAVGNFCNFAIIGNFCNYWQLL